MRDIETITADAVVIGAGLAGLSTALHLAPLSTVVLAKTPLGEGAASLWAQGGIAAAIGADDSAALHAEDTRSVGGGIVDAATADLVTAEAAEAVLDLERLGVRFDRAGAGAIALGLEAGHSRRRILHIGGDSTGREVMRGVIAAARQASWIRVIEGAGAEAILVEDDGAVGVLARLDGRPVLVAASAVILASGGIGRLYRHTTNPASARGDGIAMAARAGARLADLEFVQFHPTALDVGLDPMPLATEALRGEGAVLVDENSRRFMIEAHAKAELAPRDVVARSIAEHRRRGHRTFLDCRQAVGDRFAARFPTVFAHCRAAGLDPTRDPLPVAPAEHYHMGGVAVDGQGRSSVARLWACGEVASTGLHGANRLASNSLLEALVFARRIAADIRDARPVARRIALEGALPAAPAAESADVVAEIRRVMDERVGVVREASGLARALAEIAALARRPEAREPAITNLLTVARLVAGAALLRRESRGGHFRSDYPALDPRWQRRSSFTADELDRALGQLPEMTS